MGWDYVVRSGLRESGLLPEDTEVVGFFVRVRWKAASCD